MNAKLVEPKDKLTGVELDRVIVCVRLCRLHREADRMVIEERHRVLGDRYALEAMLHVDNDLFILTSCIIKLDTLVRNRMLSN